MTVIGQVLRPFTWDDVRTYARLLNETGAAEGAGTQLTDQEAAEHLRQPNLSPLRDCVIAEVDGLPAGFSLTVPELLIGRTIVEGTVHPAYRRKGLGRKLLDNAVEHSRALKARVVHASASPDAEALLRLLETSGFTKRQRQVQMRLKVDDLKPGEPGSGYEVRPLAEGEANIFSRIQNLAFDGSWGFAPNTPQELDYRLHMIGASYSDVLLLFVDGQPAAYCWTRMQRVGPERRGIIWMIGADPAFRGQGLGRAMLLQSISLMLTRGASAFELTVYADNAPAVKLYESVGFTWKEDILWYELEL
jgi:mycothiol synthase